MNGIILTALMIIAGGSLINDATAQSYPGILTVKKTEDFTITGDGRSPQWNKTEWLPITVQESAGHCAGYTHESIVF